MSLYAPTLNEHYRIALEKSKKEKKEWKKERNKQRALNRYYRKKEAKA